MVKEVESYNDRLKKAALEGVIMRLENDQPYYVVEFLKKCSSPQLVYESKKVREMAVKHFTDGFNHRYTSKIFGGDVELKTALSLLRAIKMKETEITKLILDYFAEYSSKYSWAPHDFENILELFPISAKELNENKNLVKAVHSETVRGMDSHDEFRRQLCFLKYFSLSNDERLKLAKRAISDSAFTRDNERIDEKILESFIQELKLNRGEILSILTEIISSFIGHGFIDQANVLVKRYSLDQRIFLSETNKKMAVKGVLNHYDNGDPERITEAKQMIETFGLVRGDFEDDQLTEAIGKCMNDYGFENLIELIEFADFPKEKITSLIRSNLSEIALVDNDKLLPFLEKYDIGWIEVVEAAKRRFIESLSASGGKHLKAYINKFDFSKEFLVSEAVVNAAKEGLIVLYKYADHDDNIGFLKETFGIS